MASLKAIKRKSTAPGPYREALIALGYLHQRIDVLKVANGDTVLFALGDHSKLTTEMVKVFMDVLKERGIDDVNCFLCGTGDRLESIPIEQFAAIARMRGFYASGVESPAPGDGDSGTPSGAAQSGESGTLVDVEEPAPRLCLDERDESPGSSKGEREAKGVRVEAAPSLKTIPEAEGSSSEANTTKTARNALGACEGLGYGQGERKPEEGDEESLDSTAGVGLLAEDWKRLNEAAVRVLLDEAVKRESAKTCEACGEHPRILYDEQGREDGFGCRCTVEMLKAKGVSFDAAGRVLPARDEEQPGASGSEGENQGLDGSEGVRAEEETPGPFDAVSPEAIAAAVDHCFAWLEYTGNPAG